MAAAQAKLALSIIIGNNKFNDSFRATNMSAGAPPPPPPAAGKAAPPPFNPDSGAANNPSGGDDHDPVSFKKARRGGPALGRRTKRRARRESRASRVERVQRVNTHAAPRRVAPRAALRAAPRLATSCCRSRAASRHVLLYEPHRGTFR